MNNTKYQYSRNELKEKHINRLQEKYNDLYKENIELKEKYNRLCYASIDAVFSEFNDDVELLARCLYNQGKIARTETYYLNPYNNMMLEKRNIKESE